jgi:TonB-linked SusC/RagA family outer membrane protein
MTTKRGKQSSGIKVQYNTQTGVTVLAAPKFDMMSSLQKINHLKSQGIAFTDTSDSEIAAIAKQSNTNWADAILRQGITQSHNLSVSTGTERTNSYTSLGMFKQEGVVRGSDLKRFNIRNNFNGKSKNDKFDFGTTVAVGYSEANDLDVENAGNNSNSGNPFFVGYIGLPYNSPYNPDGSPNILGNGTTSINNSEYNYQNSVVYESNVEEELKMLGSLNMSYKITDNIKAGTRIGIDYTQITGKSIVDPRGLRGSEIVNDGNAANQGFQGESFFRDSRFSSLAFLGYNKVFKEKHTLDLNLYTEYNHSFTNSFSYGQSGLNPLLVGYGSAFVEGTTTEDLNGDGIISVTEAQLYAPTVGSGKIQVSNFAYFGIAKYDYDAKYGFQGTLRRDASSRFTGDNKWGTFYSVSGYWNLSNESFMSNSTFNKLKLRASYGSTGNERFSGTYYGGFNDYLNLYSQGTGYNNSVSIGPAQIANENLKWETTYQANVGIDFGIKNNKLSGSLDLYNKDTQDLFLDTPQSNITHTSSVVSNIGRLRNRGVELNLRYNIFKTDDFSFSVFATGSYNQNELRELNGTDIIEGNTTALSVGSAADSFYMVRWAGVNPANGNPLYYDINGDLTETYDVSDRVLKDKSAAPVYQGGFGFNTNYKGFSLDTQFSWAAEYYRVNAELAVIEDPSIVNSTNWNASTTILNAWQQPGDITDIPALNASSTRLFSTDRYLEDASYLRLKNISIGYNFSRVIKDSWAISGVKVYLQAENLFTLSKYRGFAPEPDYLTRTFFAYPNPQIYTFGLDINF